MTTPRVSSLAELARLAGVSISTVSRSLAGNPAIATATRERIEALAVEYGSRRGWERPCRPSRNACSRPTQS